MSTDYKFLCKECKKSGGLFTRQAWGWGNADIIDSFQFVMKHVDNCTHNIEIISEHCDEYWNSEEDEDKDLQGYFPCSDDWDKKEFDKKWKAHRDYLKIEEEEDDEEDEIHE